MVGAKHILILMVIFVSVAQAQQKAVLFLEPKGTIMEVVRAAKERGFKAIALVRNRSSLDEIPAPYDSANACLSEVSQVKDWTRLDDVFKLAKKIDSKTPVAGVYGGTEPTAVAVSLLRQEFKLPATSKDTIELVIDKYRLRRALIDAGLSKLAVVDGAEADKWDEWKFPGGVAYFKPRRGLASLGVRKVSSLDELRKTKDEFLVALEGYPEIKRDYIKSGGGYFLEGVAQGELLSVESISHQGTMHVLGLLSRIMHSTNKEVEMGSVFPYPHRLTDEIVAHVRRAHQVAKYINGLSHVEVMVSGDGTIEIIDFNPRFVGADVLQSINHAYNLSIQEVLLDFATGKFTEFCAEATGYCCLQYAMAPPDVTEIDTITLPSGSDVVFTSAFVHRGAVVNQQARQIDTIGCYLVKQSTFEGALQRSHALRKKFKVNGRANAGF